MKGMFKLKRIIALLLSIALCLSLLPGVEVAEAANDLTNSSLINNQGWDTVLGNISITDGGKYSISTDGGSETNTTLTVTGTIYVSEGSTLTFHGGNTLMKGDYTIVNDGTISFRNWEVPSGSTIRITGTGVTNFYYSDLAAGGSIIMNSGHLNSTEAEVYGYVEIKEDATASFSFSGTHHSGGEIKVENTLVAYNSTAEEGAILTCSGDYSVFKTVFSLNATTYFEETPVGTFYPINFHGASGNLVQQNVLLEGSVVMPVSCLYDNNNFVVESMVYKGATRTWYIDKACTKPITVITEETLADAEKSAEIGRWSYNLYSELEFTASAEDVEVVYDEQPHSITVTAPEGATITYSTDGANYSETNPQFIDVGNYIVHWKATIEGKSVAGSAKVKIRAREVTIVADSQSKFYGDADPEEFTYSVALPKNYKVTGITLSRDQGEEIGSYNFIVDTTNAKITEDNVDVTDEYINKIVCEPGVFTIKPRELTITADDAEKIYGNSEPDAFTYTVTGLLEGHKLSDSSTITLNRVAGDAVGTYEITVNASDVAVEDASGNDVTAKYDVNNLVTNPGTFTITRRPLTVYANDAEIPAGDPAEDIVYSQGYDEEMLLQGHTVNVSGTPTCTYNEERGTARYPITPAPVTITNSGADVTDNYDITYVNGTLLAYEQVVIIIIPDQLVVNEKNEDKNSASIIVDFSHMENELYGFELNVTSTNASADASADVGENDLLLMNEGKDPLKYKVVIAHKKVPGADFGEFTVAKKGSSWDIPHPYAIFGNEMYSQWEFSITATRTGDEVPMYGGAYTDVLTFSFSPEFEDSIAFA